MDPSSEGLKAYITPHRQEPHGNLRTEGLGQANELDKAEGASSSFSSMESFSPEDQAALQRVQEEIAQAQEGQVNLSQTDAIIPQSPDQPAVTQKNKPILTQIVDGVKKIVTAPARALGWATNRINALLFPPPKANPPQPA